ncbi:GDYXXLXY domain-containing protein [Halobacillus massiliensis]|uniref:GDYXXLXY domain-containing protein n=1 Tax=Halobacillus massiliensis TaxID=1926286 RepID=UPI0009E53D14|nr:GDYXXLXY domain-containing protein [Halobacillus massiliensis]
MKRWIFYLIIGLQFIFLISMMAAYYLMDEVGETIRLETEPMDPRDPFYGDYVTLRYSIEEVPKERWIAEQEPQRGDIVYLLLEEKENGLYELVSASDQQQESQSNQVELKAKLEWPLEDSYQMNIGLDRYFVEEGSGQELEQEPQQIVEIVVAPWGQKKIAGIQ